MTTLAVSGTLYSSLDLFNNYFYITSHVNHVVAVLSIGVCLLLWRDVLQRNRAHQQDHGPLQQHPQVCQEQAVSRAIQDPLPQRRPSCLLAGSTLHARGTRSPHPPLFIDSQAVTQFLVSRIRVLQHLRSCKQYHGSTVYSKWNSIPVNFLTKGKEI